MKPGKVLIASDELAICDAMRDLLDKEGYIPLAACSCAQALQMALEQKPAVAVIDIRLADQSGTKLVSDLKQMDPCLIIIVMTDHTDGNSSAVAAKEGGGLHLRKPVQADELLRLLEHALELIRLRQDKDKAEQRLKWIERLLTRETKSELAQDRPRNFRLSSCCGQNNLYCFHGLIEAFGADLLGNMAGDYLNLLDTSAAIYEKNGDHAVRIIVSGWCRLLNNASRTLCGPEDDTKALKSGKWYCRESCWTDSARIAIEKGEPVDVECRGGIRIYAVPVLAGNEVVGAMNFGYGDPPTDQESLMKISRLYGVSIEELREQAELYESRPSFITDLAMARLKTCARMIGEMFRRRRTEDSLSEMTAFCQLSSAAARIGHWKWDLRTNETYLSSQWRSDFGYPDDEMSNQIEEWKSRIHPGDRERVFRSLEDYLAGRHADNSEEYRLRYRDGSYRWVCTRGTAQLDSNGKPYRLVGCHIDITERKQAEEALLESEKFNSILLNSSPYPVLVINSDKSVRYVNPAFETLTGFSMPEIAGKKIPYPWWPAESLERTGKEFELAVSSGVDRLEKLFQNKSGEHFWVEITGKPIVDSDQLRYYLSSWVDITERKHREKLIRNLTHNLIAAQENERRKISLELHDNVAQDLLSAKILCEMLLENQPQIKSKGMKTIKDLSRIITGAVDTIRDMAYDLRPLSLDQLGLTQTICQYCEDFNNKYHIKVDFEAAGVESLQLHGDTKINLYRLVQEGLNNIKKHADASQVYVRMIASYPYIILRIEDNGIGFDLGNRLSQAANERRMGLYGMEERVSLLQGKMKIDSSPGKGTKIWIKVKG